MAFLVLSTSLCLIRNTPKMLKDMRSWRENVREQSLRNFHHKAEWQSLTTRPQLESEITAYLGQQGYKFKVLAKTTPV